MIYKNKGRSVIGICGSLIWSKTLMEPCGESRWSLEGPISQIHSPHLYFGASGIFLDLLRSVQMLKREWGAECNGKLSHLFIHSKTVSLVPEFAVKRPTLGRTLWWWSYIESVCFVRNDFKTDFGIPYSLFCEFQISFRTAADYLWDFS